MGNLYVVVQRDTCNDARAAIAAIWYGALQRGELTYASAVAEVAGIEGAALRRCEQVTMFVTPERGFYIRANAGAEFGVETEALKRLLAGAPYIKVRGRGGALKLKREQVDLAELQHMLENYQEWNRRDIAARNRLQMYG